jgi:hypothetical protein
MAIRTLMSIEQYDALPEKEGVKYELNEGELVTVSPSPRLVHYRVRSTFPRSEESPGIAGPWGS